MTTPGDGEAKCFRCDGRGFLWDAGIGDYDCPNCAGKGTVGMGEYWVIDCHSATKKHLIYRWGPNPPDGNTICGHLRIHLSDVRSATAPESLPKKEQASICKDCLWRKRKTISGSSYVKRIRFI